MGIKVKCRNCNREADCESFKLHYKFKAMVCPDCFSGRTEQLQKRVDPLKKVEPKRPPGWDAEDEYLEKIARLKKEENQDQFKRIHGSSKVMCKCFNCNFSFRYDPFKRTPGNCPCCDSEVPRVKTYNLL